MIDISMLDGRDYVVLAAVLALAYVVFLLLRLFRMLRKKRLEAEAGAKGSPLGAWERNAFDTPHHEPAIGSDLIDSLSASRSASFRSSEDKKTPDFNRELARSSLELEVHNLRQEIVLVRSEMSRLAEEVRQLKAAGNVSPLYSQAMTLAQQGVTTAGIADQCGISIGEAELVAALARSEAGYDTSEKEGSRDDRYTDSTR
jgi:hypothetical protein